MKLIVIGCSYRTATVDLRERLAFTADEQQQALKELVRLPDVEDALLLSTCNRVEVWATTRRPEHGRREVVDFLSRSRGVPVDELTPCLFEYQEREAMIHLFRVTASLDAMVVGEAQIAGQVKEAFAAASRAGTLGSTLNRCMHKALGASKRVRNETEIARHPVSISSVAADMAARVFGDLRRSTVIVLGAGEMAELAVRHLLSGGSNDVRVINRTHEKAVALAFALGATAHRYEDLRGQLIQGDILITSTGSEEPVLTRDDLAGVMKARKQRPLFIVDIAVPRDVEKAAGDLPNVYLFDIDDLEQVVTVNLRARQREAGPAEEIVRLEVAHFEQWLLQQDAVPVIKELREHFQEVVRAEVDHAVHQLDLTGPEQKRVMEQMTAAIVKKLLHMPTVELKSHAARSDGTFLAKATSHLFHLAGGNEPVGTKEK